jgi:hypothetical protein
MARRSAERASGVNIDRRLGLLAFWSGHTKSSCQPYLFLTLACSREKIFSDCGRFPVVIGDGFAGHQPCGRDIVFPLHLSYFSGPRGDRIYGLAVVLPCDHPCDSAIFVARHADKTGCRMTFESELDHLKRKHQI